MELKIFSVLAEQNRLDIIELLRTGAKPVNEIVDRLNLNQPQVSKHLKILSDAGFVMIRPIAQQHYYQLQHKPFQELDRWLAKYKTIWQERFKTIDQLLAKEVRKK